MPVLGEGGNVPLRRRLANTLLLINGMKQMRSYRTFSCVRPTGTAAGTPCRWPTTLRKSLSATMGPRAGYRAVVAECALIIYKCAPARVAVIAQCAPTTCVVIAPSYVAYRAATAKFLDKNIYVN